MRASMLFTAAALVVAGCALQPARMDLPAGFLAQVDQAEVTGLGGGTRGRYALQAHAGEFARSASRLSLFDDLYVADRGGTSFTIAGPLFPEPVRTSCRVRQSTVSISIVGFAAKPLAYTCDFALNGAALSWRMAVWEGRSATNSQSLQAERRGEIVVGETRLALRSTHAIAGTAIPASTPIGYLMERDGRTVGAIELNGTSPAVFFPRQASAEQQQAVVLAALALAVLWDPANL